MLWAWCGFLGGTIPAATAAEPAAGQQRSEVVLVTQSGGRFTFAVEIADNAAEKRRGLMFRNKMESNQGMLFLYRPATDVAIWMKNTLLPLDIIFIDASGRISRIEADAVPLSETNLRSGGPVGAVLEINGGMARYLGVSVGDRVVYAPRWPDADSP